MVKYPLLCEKVSRKCSVEGWSSMVEHMLGMWKVPDSTTSTFPVINSQVTGDTKDLHWKDYRDIANQNRQKRPRQINCWCNIRLFIYEQWVHLYTQHAPFAKTYFNYLLVQFLSHFSGVIKQSKQIYLKTQNCHKYIPHKTACQNTTKIPSN